MALVCPVGHPAGVGTSFCRLCGRDYVEVEDVPATGALAMIGAPGEAAAPAAPAPSVQVPPPPPAPSVLTPPAPPVPVPAQGLPTGPPAGSEGLAAVVPMPPSAAPLPPAPAAPVPDAQPFPPVPVETGAHTVELPLVAVDDLVPAQAEAPELESVSPVKAAMDRTVLLAATGAGFAGGAVAGALLHSLLG